MNKHVVALIAFFAVTLAHPLCVHGQSLPAETAVLVDEANAVWRARNNKRPDDIRVARELTQRIDARLALVTAQTAPHEFGVLQRALAQTTVNFNTFRTQRAMDRALDALAKETYPLDWARTHKVRAEFFIERAEGSTTFVRRGAEAALAALSVMTIDAQPRDYAALRCLSSPALQRALLRDPQAAPTTIYTPQVMLVLSICADAMEPNPMEPMRVVSRLTSVLLATQMLPLAPEDRVFLLEGFRGLQVDAALSLDGIGLSPQALRDARVLRGQASAQFAAAQTAEARIAAWRTRARFNDYVLNATALSQRARTRPINTNAVSVMIFDKERALFGIHKGQDVEVMPTPGGWPLRMSMGMVGANFSGAGAETQIASIATGTPATRWMQRYGEQDVISAIDEFRADYERVYSPALRQAIERAGVRKDAKLLLVPDGAAAMLPLGLLRDARTGRTLIEDFEITYAPSLASAAIARQRAQTARADGLAFIAPPASESGLAFVEAESAIARAAMGPTTATADKRLLARALAGAGVWHFATHGAFRADAPLQSGLQLSGGEMLTLSDLLHAEQPFGAPRLVILSACETGLFDATRDTEDFIGLPTGFLQAGAAGVIASLWPVSDASTALLMMRFYEAYKAQGQSPPSALRAAQVWLKNARKTDLLALVDAKVAGNALSAEAAAMLRTAIADAQGEQPFASPFFWGAFVYYGA